MRRIVSVFLVLTGVGLLETPFQLAAQDLGTQAFELERRGEAAQARELLHKSVQDSPKSVGAWRAYAEFLDQHRDPEVRAAYAKLLELLKADNAPVAQQTAVVRRLTTLSLLSGDAPAVRAHLETYNKLGGTDLAWNPTPRRVPEGRQTIDIPGPIRSFARMSGLSPDLRPEDLLGALARNVVTNGYQATNSSEGLDQTEYLKLVIRYLSQARELERLTGEDKMIRVEQCESAKTGELLKVLGYRMRGGCGSDVVLETVNASRAFLTIDSGFPLADLEQSLRTNRPFVHNFKPTSVPVLYGVEYWQTARDKQPGEFIDAFLAEPSLCRLYLGLSKLEPDTAEELRKAIPVQRLKAYSHVLDFYGSLFEIRDGRVVIPGGAKSEKAWTELAGASPDKGGAFLEKLLAKDDGWLASYFDALLRINGTTRDYLTDPDRLKRFYTAIRGRVTSPGPARPVFRANTDMILLTTRLQMDANGKPHVPGSLDVWKNLFVNHPHGKYDGKLTKAAGGWKDPDDLLEALFGLSRKAVENEPLKIYMALTDVDRYRAKPLEPGTIDRLAREYHTLGGQYSLFAENPAVSDKTILAYLELTQMVTKTGDQMIRADFAGMLQSLLSLWQIFCRQGSIAAADSDAALFEIVSAFTKPRNSRDVFDAGRAGVKTLLAAAKSPSNVNVQDRMMDLIAGSGSPVESDARTQMMQDQIRIFESQRLVSLQTIFELSDNLESVAKGEKLNTALAAKLAARIAEVQLPRSSLSAAEKNSLAFGYWTEKHIENQRKMNLRSAIEKSQNDAEKLKDLRGQLTPILRDTLVGFNYIHYAPPGAQILQTNPLFVRSHDFLGIQGSPQTWKHTEVFGSGWPASAGGRLVGSLATLPYALAEAEQNFLIPSREQALIWGDLVPQLLQSAVIPRWWTVTPGHLHWVSLHMSAGENLLAEAALSQATLQKVLTAFNAYAPPARVRKVALLLREGDVPGALEQVTPAELFRLAADVPTTGGISEGIKQFTTPGPTGVNYGTMSRVFGTPKPTLANSFRPELLNMRTFPTLMGYSSRILAESWESNMLFYAALADEMHVSPAQLNVLIPAWTQQTVERIFATHLEDWPALLRSLRMVGDDVRQKARKQAAAAAEN